MSLITFNLMSLSHEPGTNVTRDLLSQLELGPWLAKMPQWMLGLGLELLGLGLGFPRVRLRASWGVCQGRAPPRYPRAVLGQGSLTSLLRSRTYFCSAWAAR